MGKHPDVFTAIQASGRGISLPFLSQWQWFPQTKWGKICNTDGNKMVKEVLIFSYTCKKIFCLFYRFFPQFLLDPTGNGRVRGNLSNGAPDSIISLTGSEPTPLYSILNKTQIFFLVEIHFNQGLLFYCGCLAQQNCAVAKKFNTLYLMPRNVFMLRLSSNSSHQLDLWAVSGNEHINLVISGVSIQLLVSHSTIMSVLNSAELSFLTALPKQLKCNNLLFTTWYKIIFL